MHPSDAICTSFLWISICKNSRTSHSDKHWLLERGKVITADRAETSTDELTPLSLICVRLINPTDGDLSPHSIHHDIMHCRSTQQLQRLQRRISWDFSNYKRNITALFSNWSLTLSLMQKSPSLLIYISHFFFHYQIIQSRPQ